MSTIELKQKIINQLSIINDISFLKAIEILVESKAQEEIYILSDNQKERIRIGREQFKNNQTITNEEMNKEIEKWLAAK